MAARRRLVVDAYSQLVAEGFLLSRHGSGTRVATVDAASAPQHAEPTRRYDVDFSPGSPDLGSFPAPRGYARCAPAWPKSVRSHSDISNPTVCSRRVSRSPTIFDAPAACRPKRSTSCFCSGATQAVALLGRALQGSELPLAMEDPGFWLHRMVLRHNGIEPLAVPVDEDGLDIAALADSGAQTVLTTPAHQSPTGVVLSATRRTALVEWTRAGHLVIEDDYDAARQYPATTGRRVGALHGRSTATTGRPSVHCRAWCTHRTG